MSRFLVGDVIRFHSDEAGKVKYHLCISLDGAYLFLNSPKAITYPGDFLVPCSELPFLAPTEEGYTIISCSLVMKKSDVELITAGAKKLGCVPADVLRDLAEFVSGSQILTDEERENFLEAVGDWI
jgi:hypothetical protein